jgi:hypothetical protein
MISDARRGGESRGAERHEEQAAGNHATGPYTVYQPPYKRLK